mmetsp:Transcript_35948/g.103289  ORF Transcript_35948/g.103289 Transcript_35948/m.103289 type:complete len:234 (+) Transcript_35948:1055-1756(+)
MLSSNPADSSSGSYTSSEASGPRSRFLLAGFAMVPVSLCPPLGLAPRPLPLPLAAPLAAARFPTAFLTLVESSSSCSISCSISDSAAPPAALAFAGVLALALDARLAAGFSLAALAFGCRFAFGLALALGSGGEGGGEGGAARGEGGAGIAGRSSCCSGGAASRLRSSMSIRSAFSSGCITPSSLTTAPAAAAVAADGLALAQLFLFALGFGSLLTWRDARFFPFGAKWSSIS